MALTDVIGSPDSSFGNVIFGALAPAFSSLNFPKHKRFLARLVGYDNPEGPSRPVYGIYCCARNAFYGIEVTPQWLARLVGYDAVVLTIDSETIVFPSRPVYAIGCIHAMPALVKAFGRLIGYDYAGVSEPDFSTRPVYLLGECPATYCGCLQRPPDHLVLHLITNVLCDQPTTLVDLFYDGSKWVGTFEAVNAEFTGPVTVCFFCFSIFGSDCRSFVLCFACGSDNPLCGQSGSLGCAFITDIDNCTCDPPYWAFPLESGPGEDCSGPAGLCRWGGVVTIP